MAGSRSQHVNCLRGAIKLISVFFLVDPIIVHRVTSSIQTPGSKPPMPTPPATIPPVPSNSVLPRVQTPTLVPRVTEPRAVTPKKRRHEDTEGSIPGPRPSHRVFAPGHPFFPRREGLSSLPGILKKSQDYVEVPPRPSTWKSQLPGTMSTTDGRTSPVSGIMSETIPPPPPTQALNTATFVPPPLDLSLSVAEIIDFHRTHSPNHVVYVYEDAPGERKQIVFSTWVRAIHRAGRYVRDLFQLPEPRVGGVKPVISLLANSGERYPAAFFHPTTLTHRALTSRHDHVCHHQVRNRPRRRCHLRDFAQEFCSCCRPPHQ